MNNRIPPLIARALIMWGALSILHGPSMAAPPPSFELDQKELETVAPAARQPKRPAARPARKQAEKGEEKPKLPPRSVGEEGYSRYTVKPGDFLFKILIRDYGLSNMAAEALIPEIARINSLRSTTQLEVGQTILIPLGKRKAAPSRALPAAAQPTAAAPPPEPAPASPTPAEAAPQTPSVAKPVAQREVSGSPRPGEAAPPLSAPAPPPAVAAIEQETTKPYAPMAPLAEATFASSLLTLWEELVPGQERVEPITLNGKVLPFSDYPLLLAADSGRILVDIKGTLPPPARSQLTQKYPDIRVITRGKDNLKQFLSTLLRAAEFPSVDENFPVELGADPKVTVRPDFRIVRLPAASRGPETVLLFVDEEGPCLPPPLKDYLARKGYQAAELCHSAPDPSFAEPGYDLRAIPAVPPCDMAQALLDMLSIRLDRNRIVSGAMGANAESRFSIRVEGYFETDGKRYILNCGESDSYNYTLFRLLQLQGYGIIQPTEKDDFATVTERILKELDYPHAFGRYDLDYGRFQIAVTGFKVTRRGNSPGRILLTSRPSDPVFAELLRWEPKKR